MDESKLLIYGLWVKGPKDKVYWVCPNWNINVEQTKRDAVDAILDELQAKAPSALKVRWVKPAASRKDAFLLGSWRKWSFVITTAEATRPE